MWQFWKSLWTRSSQEISLKTMERPSHTLVSESKRPRIEWHCMAWIFKLWMTAVSQSVSQKKYTIFPSTIFQIAPQSFHQNGSLLSDLWRSVLHYYKNWECKVIFNLRGKEWPEMSVVPPTLWATHMHCSKQIGVDPVRMAFSPCFQHCRNCSSSSNAPILLKARETKEGFMSQFQVEFHIPYTVLG